MYKLMRERGKRYVGKGLVPGCFLLWSKTEGMLAMERARDPITIQIGHGAL